MGSSSKLIACFLFQNNVTLYPQCTCSMDYELNLDDCTWPIRLSSHYCSPLKKYLFIAWVDGLFAMRWVGEIDRVPFDGRHAFIWCAFSLAFSLSLSLSYFYFDFLNSSDKYKKGISYRNPNAFWDTLLQCNGIDWHCNLCNPC